MPGGFSWDPRPIHRPGARTQTQTHPHSQSSSRSYPVICHVARGRRISGRRCSTCLIAYLHVAHIREFETAARPRPNCGFLGSGYLPLLRPFNNTWAWAPKLRQWRSKCLGYELVIYSSLESFGESWKRYGIR